MTIRTVKRSDCKVLLITSYFYHLKSHRLFISMWWVPFFNWDFFRKKIYSMPCFNFSVLW